MQSQLGFIQDEKVRQIPLRLLKQRNQGEDAEHAICGLSSGEQVVRPFLSPAEQHSIVLWIEHKIREERNDQANRFDDSLVELRLVSLNP